MAIPLKATGLCGALWNFPIADAGELRARIQLPPQAKDVRLSLNDHFNRIDDQHAAERAVFTLEAAKIEWPADGRAHDLTLTWSRAQEAGEVLASVDGKAPVRVTAARAAQFGVNYLRIEFRAEADAGYVTIGQLSAQLPR